LYKVDPKKYLTKFQYVEWIPAPGKLNNNLKLSMLMSILFTTANYRI